MMKPNLTNFADFVEKPKPVIVKSAFEKHREYTFLSKYDVSYVDLFRM